MSLHELELLAWANFGLGFGVVTKWSLSVNSMQRLTTRRHCLLGVVLSSMAWCVKGKYYDLSKFKHPGGPIALQLARGRDADALIREYHPFSEDKVRAILDKYLVERPEGGSYRY